MINQFHACGRELPDENAWIALRSIGSVKVGPRGLPSCSSFRWGAQFTQVSRKREVAILARGTWIVECYGAVGIGAKLVCLASDISRHKRESEPVVIRWPVAIHDSAARRHLRRFLRANKAKACALRDHGRRCKCAIHCLRRPGWSRAADVVVPVSGAAGCKQGTLRCYNTKRHASVDENPTMDATMV